MELSSVPKEADVRRSVPISHLQTFGVAMYVCRVWGFMAAEDKLDS